MQHGLEYPMNRYALPDACWVLAWAFRQTWPRLCTADEAACRLFDTSGHTFLG